MSDRAREWSDRLRDAGFRGELREREPLAPLTTWKIGGAAELLARPGDADDLVVAVRTLARDGVRWRVLANGSNLLVDDAGVRGVVLHVRRRLDRVEWTADGLTAGAGAMLPVLANGAAARGLTGLEFGAGIPGTVGGAVRMNAGWHEHEFGNHVTNVRFLRADGDVCSMPKDACAFGYRSSAFADLHGVVLEARLRLQRDDPARIRERMDGYLRSRKANQPTDLPSCGSVFLKPPGDFAGRLIDQAGLKGLRIGDIEVSPKHANFFVNVANGRSADVLRLVERVEAEIERRFGVRLVREFVYWTD